MTSRIELTDSPVDVVRKMAQGNAGAAGVLALMLSKGARIDPDSVWGGLTGMLHLDAARIYGARVWQLYKDVCNSDLTRMLGLLRAAQMGLLSSDRLTAAVDGKTRMTEEEIVARLAEVRVLLPAFGRAEERAL